jgi:hypothetical protein
MRKNNCGALCFMFHMTQLLEMGRSRAQIMYLVNFELLKSSKLTIDHLEVGKLKRKFYLRATK